MVLLVMIIGLMTGPRQIGNEVTVLVRDILMPGQQVLARSIDFTTEKFAEIEHNQRTANESRIEKLERELLQLKFKQRRQQLANANLWERWKRNERFGSDPFRGVQGKRLFVQDLLEVRVLGRETSLLWQGKFLLDQGQRSGLHESDLVLQSKLPLIDQGEREGLKEGQPVFMGQCVAGRIQKVGLWSSAVERVSDKKFRAKAQLVQKTKDEFRFGPRGILEGTGKGYCRLKFVDVQQVVNVGDHVFSQHDDGFSVPMYFGKVIEAKILPGESHWEILIEPAVKKMTANKVFVLRKKLNPARFTAN